MPSGGGIHRIGSGHKDLRFSVSAVFIRNLRADSGQGVTAPFSAGCIRRIHAAIFEPRRVCRRLVSVRCAAMGSVSGASWTFASASTGGMCDGRNVPDGLRRASVVEPADPFEGCAFDGFEVAPRTTTVDDLGPEDPVDCLGQRIVMAVADAPDRGCDACFCEPLGGADGQILAAAVAMVDQPHAFCRAAFMDCLFEGIEDETRMGRSE